MRAHEFIQHRLREDRNVTINIPITIRIPDGAGDPEVDVAQRQANDNASPVMVSPLQQELELKKAQLGKDSEVIQDLVEPEEPTDEGDAVEVGDQRSRRAPRPAPRG